jgi:23S rRNA A1618 N6-methylase RlmF
MEEICDFSRLAERYPELLRRYVYTNRQGKPAVNFNDSHVQRAVTRALLLDRYELLVELPEDRLCPTVITTLLRVPNCYIPLVQVPSRENYLRFIHDKLLLVSDADETSSVCGIDMYV